MSHVPCISFGSPPVKRVSVLGVLRGGLPAVTLTLRLRLGFEQARAVPVVELALLYSHKHGARLAESVAGVLLGGFG